VNRFNIGDRVRVTKRGIGATYGEVFVVTKIREGYNSATGGERYYEGDEGGHGVWENFLTPAPELTPQDFDGDTSPEALEAWAIYKSLPANFDATPEQSAQDAFTAAFDLGRQVNR
jgi:hypothetical protein